MWAGWSVQRLYNSNILFPIHICLHRRLLPKRFQTVNQKGAVAKGLTLLVDSQCFRHSDLVNDRPSTAQFKEKLPWFLDALPSADCAKGGHGAYTNSLDLSGMKDTLSLSLSQNKTHSIPCVFSVKFSS
jgi:hypothetical protein